MYNNLQKGVLPDLLAGKNPQDGTLSVLFGYSPGFFEITGLQRKPLQLREEWLFQRVKLGGEPVLPGVGLRYGDDITCNDIANDHIVVQFIGDTQLVTNRPIVETWKLLRKIDMDGSSAPMVMRSFFTGFNRPDGRSWLGFHDGISNIKSSERLKNIQIDKHKLDPADYWTASGTYMAFLRISVDLNLWEKLTVPEQERIVGREKATGCPLIGRDKYGNNVFAVGCPVDGTSEIIEKGNEKFRDYSYVNNALSTNPESEVRKSHVERMRKIPDRIFRQGYEFLEPIRNYPYFRIGLNFVSFQGGTDKLYRVIKQGFDRINFGGGSGRYIPGIDNLLAVHAAGIFLVPPFRGAEEFPGDIIFDKREIISPYDTRFHGRNNYRKL
jgi:hypothetical protein